MYKSNCKSYCSLQPTYASNNNNIISNQVSTLSAETTPPPLSWLLSSYTAHMHAWMVIKISISKKTEAKKCNGTIWLKHKLCTYITSSPPLFRRPRQRVCECDHFLPKKYFAATFPEYGRVWLEVMQNPDISIPFHVPALLNYFIFRNEQNYKVGKDRVALSVYVMLLRWKCIAEGVRGETRRKVTEWREGQMKRNI